MAKLTRKQKIEIYKTRKQGSTISSLSKKYNISKHNISYLIRLIDYHGFDVLRNNRNRYYSPALKQEIINNVLLLNHSIFSTSIKYGLSSDGMLFNWIKSYKENKYVIVEKTRGRSPTTAKEKKLLDPNDKDAIIKLKDEEILRLKAENEYLKKLRAVVQARKNQQPKKK